jgi:2-polyprenyl-3-methyl-5-hydroxy-6-metoxy-1,4-benzoquinol methylase
MVDYSAQNKMAWEYDAYEFWRRHNGTPAELAAKLVADPHRTLRRYEAYFGAFDGVRIANICGSCGKKAVPLALLGADVTVFDISQDNRRYAMELAEAAGTSIRYEVGDVMETDLTIHGGQYDIVFMEGGILHYFFDLPAFMQLMAALLKPDGKLILSDFHPLTKIMDVLNFQRPTMGYFSTDILEAEMPHARFYADDIRRQFPKCQLRLYTLSEIINGVISAGLALERYDEHPAWTDPDVPGEYTIIARK